MCTDHLKSRIYFLKDDCIFKLVHQIDEVLQQTKGYINNKKNVAIT